MDFSFPIPFLPLGLVSPEPQLILRPSKEGLGKFDSRRGQSEETHYKVLIWVAGSYS